MLQTIFSDPRVLQAIKDAQVATAPIAGGPVQPPIPMAPAPASPSLVPGPVRVPIAPPASMVGVTPPSGVRSMEGLDTPPPVASLDGAAPTASPWFPGQYVMAPTPGPETGVPGPVDPNNMVGKSGVPSWALGMMNLAEAEPSLREQAAALSEQERGLPGPAMGRPGWRTADLLGVLPALFMGRSAPEYLGGFIQGKGQYAAEDANATNAATEAARQSLRTQAAGLIRSADNQDTLGTRWDISQGTNATRLGVAGVGAEARKYVADVTQKRLAAKDLADDASKRFIATRLAQSRETASVMARLMDLPAAARPGFAATLAGKPGFEDLDADAILAVGDYSEKEKGIQAKALTEVARRADLRAHAGYMGAMEDRLEKLTPAEVEAKKAAAQSARATARERMSRIGVNTQTARLIQEKADNYSSDLRYKYMEIQSRITKNLQEQKPTGTSVATLTGLFNSQRTIAKDQINRILKLTGEQVPDKDSPHYTAYNQAVADEQDALEKIFKLGQAGSLPNATTSGPPVAASAAGRLAPAVFGQTARNSTEAREFKMAQEAIDFAKGNTAMLQTIQRDFFQNLRVLRGVRK